MRHSVPILGIWIAVAWFASPSAQVFCAPERSRDSLVAAYQRISARAHERYRCCDTARNFHGDYAWDAAYLLDADILMYRATRDTMYLRRVTELGGRIIANRDDRTGFKDWKNIAGPGWSEVQHYQPKAGKAVVGGGGMRYLIDDAVIINPLLKFARIVRADSLRPFYPTAAAFTLRSEETVRALIGEWWSPEWGTFVFPKGSPVWCDGVNVPVNYLAMMGSDLLMLAELTSEQKYEPLALRVADSVKANIGAKGHIPVWTYWTGLGFRGWSEKDRISEHTPRFAGQTSIEDVGHGAIDAEFIADCYEKGICFTRRDVDAAADIFLNNVDRGPGLAHTLDGQGDAAKSNSIIPSYRWMRLAKYRKGIGRSFYKKFAPMAIRYGGAGGAYLLASLIYHYSAETAQ